MTIMVGLIQLRQPIIGKNKSDERHGLNCLVINFIVLLFLREIPRLEETKIEKSMYGDFSRIQTKVPPQNPYDNVNRHADVEINHSMDHMKYPTVNAKHTNHVGFLTHNRENEIKSILKKTNND